MQKHHKKFYTDPTLHLKYAAILDHKIYDIPLPAINIYTTNFDSLFEANVKTPQLLLFSIYFIENEINRLIYTLLVFALL